MIKKLGSRLVPSAEIIILFVLDMISILAIFYLAVVIRIDVLPNIYADFPQDFPHRSSIKLWWIFLLWGFFFYYEGLYTKRISFWDEFKALWKVSFFSTIGIFTIVSIGKLSSEISRTLIVLMGIISLLLLPFIRSTSKKIMRKLGFFNRRVLILGAGATGKLIARALQKEPNYGYKVIGFLDDDPEKIGKDIYSIKIHRGVDKALNYLKRCSITDVIIAMPGAGKERVKGLINNLQHKVDRILFVPDMFGIAVLGTNLKHFFNEQAFAFELKNNLAIPVNIFLKGCFDLFISVFIMLFLSIPLAVIAIIIKLDSKGPVIFSQERVGRNGRMFKCLKFRTMHENSDESLTELIRKDPNARDEWDQHWKLKYDPRITRIGRFLRKTSLDELPQIFNVFRGEMSLVGPRPVTKDEIDRYYRDMADSCFCVLPGITGLWQVSGRSNTGYDYRIALDLWYVKNWNLWLDIVILLKTFRVVLMKEGAY